MCSTRPIRTIPTKKGTKYQEGRSLIVLYLTVNNTKSPSFFPLLSAHYCLTRDSLFNRELLRNVTGVISRTPKPERSTAEAMAECIQRAAKPVYQGIQHNVWFTELQESEYFLVSYTSQAEREVRLGKILLSLKHFVSQPPKMKSEHTPSLRKVETPCAFFEYSMAYSMGKGSQKLPLHCLARPLFKMPFCRTVAVNYGELML